ncbi:uncharacterized protein KZ484_015834 [Pholidichthys leucotaenia]
MLLFLTCWIISGIMADDPMIHYQQKNTSLCLHVRKLAPYSRAEWSFSKTVIYVLQNSSSSITHTINSIYKERVNYSPENLTLCINDLKDKDAGIYEFKLLKLNFMYVTETHHVIIQEMVPKPVMIMAVLSSNLSTGCNFTVNCSIQGDWLWALCNEEGCTPSQQSFSRVNISIFTHNHTVFCSGNNHVSRNIVSASKDMCFSKFEHKPKEPQQIFLIFVIITFCVVLFIFFIIMGKMIYSAKYCHKSPAEAKKRTQLQGEAQLSSALQIQSQSLDSEPQPQARLSTSSSSEVEPYENIDAAQFDQPGRPTGDMNSRDKENTQTVYSVRNVIAASGQNNSSKNPGRRGNSEKGSESLPDEAQQPTHIDTVYSVLQKPKNLNTQHHQ